MGSLGTVFLRQIDRNPYPYTAKWNVTTTKQRDYFTEEISYEWNRLKAKEIKLHSKWLKYRKR